MLLLEVLFHSSIPLLEVLCPLLRVNETKSFLLMSSQAYDSHIAFCTAFLAKMFARLKLAQTVHLKKSYQTREQSYSKKLIPRATVL